MVNGVVYQPKSDESGQTEAAPADLGAPNVNPGLAAAAPADVDPEVFATSGFSPLKQQQSSILQNTRVIITNQRRNLRLQKEINVDNKKLLNRLMYTPSSYPKTKWEKHAKEYFWNKELL